MALATVTLDDKYGKDAGTLYLTGSQALVRLLLMQSARDRAAGHTTAGFVTGYRGSPMHNYDKELTRASAFLERAHVRFQPGVNEDTAATACWGTQQANLFPGARYDGVFAVWYAKGPGLDRSVDAMRHANLAGTSPLGGVLVAVGDDHGMKSSDVPATCEPTFADLLMPVLYPADVHELIELGLTGIALSRFCGAWVGFKTVADTLDTACTVDVDPQAPRILLPEDYTPPPGGLHIRLPDPWHGQEPRLKHHKLAAALAFARANHLNRVVLHSPRPRLGIVASGKSVLDVRQALADLGMDERKAAELGITILKVAMPFPADPECYRAFAEGLDEVLVVEEKTRLVELGVKDALYALPDARRPRVLGRHDERGALLIDDVGELDPGALTRVLAARIARFHEDDAMRARLALLDARDAERRRRERLNIMRMPYFCPGCPHNTSTRVPEGSRAHGGVGCHYMSTYMERGVYTHTHMGGEGATWIGQAPFVETPHVFQNLGDGTYHHSGLLCIRACVAAGVNITYKILFNDAVAMTGGQTIDGPLSPAMITRQVHAEGVRRIAVVTDDVTRYRNVPDLAPGTTVHERAALDTVQKELRELKGVSVLLYDQTCAAEKRRRRKRGKLADPPRRLFINDRVCEGCGDCNAKSSCLAVVPLDTEYGRKRLIDQSACNKDYSCENGFCPSFVSVIGGKPRRRAAASESPAALRELPDPVPAPLADDAPWSVLVTGIGGTGVVTVGAMLTMAAHLQGLACSAVDQFGMAQKGGAVTSHVRIAHNKDAIRAVRLGPAAADLLLGCDSLVAGADLALDTIAPGRTRAVVNTHESITGHFTRDPDILFPSTALHARLARATGEGNVDFIEATRVATALMGDSIATNLFMLGYAYQKGLVPVSEQAILRALELNAVAVESNKQAFAWGRRAAVDWQAVEACAHAGDVPEHHHLSASLDEAVERRVRDLTAYQNAAYAARYRDAVQRVRRAEAERTPGREELAQAVARYACKLMAVKDEYEVARLYTDGSFERRLREQFEGDWRLEFHMSPPLFAPRDRYTGLPRKMRFGPWMLGALRVLAKLKRLRGTALDVFGRSAERRRERALAREYLALLDEICAGLSPDNHALAVQLASLPEHVRGYGHVREYHLAQAEKQRAELLAAFRNGAVAVARAAA